MEDLEIKRMEEGDIGEVMAIERASFKQPWKREFMEAELSNPSSIPLVVLKEGKVAGYVILWDMGESLHLANIAVKPELRRKGIGRALLKKAIAIAKKRNKKLLSLEVRRSNIAARKLYESEGFRVLRVIRGYYRPDFEDALLYVLPLQGNVKSEKA
ncbi:MAG: ribosomal-protein-alanine N-acetyltransferase [Candidatus Hydrothermota bacterium]|nr:MAG: ribosomal-protein-alanine N-acetyltransferase [Candidatus Hydrothermae bacterium]